MQLRALFIAILLMAGAVGTASASSIRSLGSLRVDQVAFDETPVGEALEFLTAKSVELDPEKKGINFIVTNGVDKSSPVTLRLSDVPFGVVLAYVMELSGLESRVDAHAIRILPRNPGAAVVPPKPNTIMASRARGMVFPQIDFAEVSLGTVAGFLAQKSVEIDVEKKGVNVVLGAGVDPDTPVSLRLNDAPLTSVVGYVAEIANLKVRADRWAIVFYKPAASKPDAKTSDRESVKANPGARRPSGDSFDADVAGLQGATLGTPVKDPRSPAHPDYVKSTDPNVPARSNSLGNTYRWIGGKWTYYGPKYKKVDGKWVPAEDKGAKLEPATGLDRKPR